MSAHENTDGTDTTSIRPVSSLRSRFENLGTSDATQKPFAPVHTPSRLSQQFTGKSPLRLPTDQQSPFSRSQPSQQELGHKYGDTNGTIRPRERTETRAPRPVSMGPTSPPTTPAVLVQPPQSPPNTRSSRLAQAVGQSPPRPRSTGSGSVPYIPPLSTNLKTGGSDGLSPITGKRSGPPPPVNRASKPNVPLTPTSLAPMRLTLEDVSVSPFSTPPDSPTSPESPPGKSTFTRPPLHPQAQTRRQPTPAPIFAAPKSTNLYGSTDRSDDPERRPSLPARTPQRDHASTISTPPYRQVPDPSKLSLQHNSTTKSPNRQASPDPSRLRHSQSVRIPNHSETPPRPLEATKESRRATAVQGQTFLPPPKRMSIIDGGSSPYSQAARTQPKTLSDMSLPSNAGRNGSVPQHIHQQQTGPSQLECEDLVYSEYPDATRVNRRPPRSKIGVDQIWTGYDTRLFDICGDRVCSSGYLTKAWDTATGRPLGTELAVEETHFKILSMIFKPGARPEEEGQVVWLGSNQGEIQEVDLRYSRPIAARQAHGRHEVVKMHRYQDTIWTLDNDARLFVWLPDESTGVPNLDISPNSHRVAKGHTFSIIARGKLWLATGKELRVYDPVSGHEKYFHVTKQALSQPGTGDIISGAVLPSQPSRVYFGHSDGKVSIYSTDDYSCQAVMCVSIFKLTTMAGVGNYIWVGLSTGYMFVYDTASTPWKVLKEWKAHDNKAVANIIVNRSSVWKFGHLQVASIGLDNAIKLWDGMLEQDWAETRMHEHDVEYCNFREIKTVVVTWNAGASTPADIRHDQVNSNFFRESVQPHDPPDLMVFGFQELVDLEDKGLTAKNFFKGKAKKQGHDPEHMGRQYRAWRDYLTQLLDENMPTNESYTLLQTGSMVGLFSCIFVKTSQRKRIRDLGASEVKRGMGGLYGNKGAIMIRFVLDSTSLCFINCHLAAGQKESNARNNDATAILEATALGMVKNPEQRMDCYIGGGDGTMVFDHEICVLNGDLNYRIDTMGRDSVVKTIQAGNLDRLLERDQLLLAKRRNAAFRLRLFREDRITFAPTYKYDVGTDRYDSSEKHRSPAWCDRVLYRGHGRVKMVEYRRHECRASDHRPVSGTFLMRIKNIDPESRERVWAQVQKELVGMKVQAIEMINTDYLVNILGMDPQDARRRLSQ